jgi:hypothetical protein
VNRQFERCRVAVENSLYQSTILGIRVSIILRELCKHWLCGFLQGILSRSQQAQRGVFSTHFEASVNYGSNYVGRIELYA